MGTLPDVIVGVALCNIDIHNSRDREIHEYVNYVLFIALFFASLVSVMRLLSSNRKIRLYKL